MTLNGSTDGVVYTDETIEWGTTSAAWGDFKDYAVATLYLKEGVNTVEFTVITSCNVEGIGFKSVVPVTLGIDSCEHAYGEYVVEVAPTYDSVGELGAYCTTCGRGYKKVAVLPVVSEENGYTKIGTTDAVSEWKYTYEGKTYTVTVNEIQTYTFTILDNDPFVAEVGGSTVTGGYDGFGLMTNKYGTFYQNTRLGTFTLTVNVPQAANVELSIFVASTNGYTFDLAEVFTAVTLNGGTEGVTKATGSVSTVGWYVSTATEAKIATLSLNAGTNVISFTMGDTSKTLNIGSVVFKSPVVVALGSAPVHTHSFTFVSEVPASCETVGTKAYYRCDCGVMASDAEGANVITVVETIPATDHTEETVLGKAATCTETGLTDGMKCTVCGKTTLAQEIIPALGHTEETVLGKAATCTETGLTDGKKCTVCGETTVAQEVIPALGHKDENGDYKCDVCGNTLCTNHVEESIPAQAATCTVAGLTEGKKCANCGQILLAQEAVPALGHDIVTKDAVAPTCTATGLTAGQYCTRCSDETVEQTVVDALGHDIVTLDAVAPTCTETGWTAGQYCTRCNDETVEQTVVDALGHTLAGEWTLSVAPTYDAEGSLTNTCSVCGEVSLTLPMISGENGYTKGIGGVLTRWTYVHEGQTFTFDITETVETTTYSWRAEAWYVSLDGTPVGKEGYKYTTGAWDGTNLSFGGNGTTYTTTVVVSEPTTATLIIRCARNKAKPFFTAGTEHCIDNLQVNGSADNVICNMNAKLSVAGWHTYTDYEVATVFLAKGVNTISFTSATTVNFQGIGFKATEEIHMHTDVIDAGVTAMCTTEGLTEGIHCSECDAVIVAQEVIPAGGAHTWATEYSVATAPTYLTEGALAIKCVTCNSNNEESFVTMPVVLEENGYVKVASTDSEEQWQYVYGEQTFDIVIPTLYEFTIADNDPFLAENGGSVVQGTAEGSTAVGKNTNQYGTFYENTKGATFTLRINAAEAMDVNFVIKVSSTADYTFDLADVVTAITLNGEETGVIRKEGTVSTTGWYVSSAGSAEIATLSLQKGVNVISFTAGTATAKTLNIGAIVFSSAEYLIALVTPCEVHTEVIVSGYVATCTETGLTDGMKCTVCGKTTLGRK